MRCVSVMALAVISAHLLIQDASALEPHTRAVTTQLPDNVRPIHYDLAVTPHAEKLAFDGRVAITLDVLEPTDSIVLNAMDMTLSSVRISPASGRAPHLVPHVETNHNAQTVEFTMPEAMQAGRYTLSIEYSGRINTLANGLFAIDYETDHGKKRALYTQFENSDARKFVPSWDEPHYKATFELTAVVPSSQMAVSNMPVTERTDQANGTTVVRFAPSPMMSTYLLFFGLGEFERSTVKTDGTEIGIVTQKGKSAQATLALESSRAVLQEYNDYFDTPYPLPKLDNIASPGRSEFFTAMENWGAIFTFEHAILVDPSISTSADRQTIFSIAAHEIAHQWFGNLVTMNWWDELWLNEGFASWMAARTMEKLHPEWSTNLYAVASRESAMERDGFESTHPVVQHVETVEQANQAFDAITYSKGEAVIRMLEGYVGADAWREGVRRYMRAHAYGNTASDDLWVQIQAAAGKPILAIAHDFTMQPGIPLIRVESAHCSGGKTTLKLSQGEFTQDRLNKAPLSWHVPVIARTGGNEPVRTVIQAGTSEMSVPGCSTLILNAGQSGYYRTLYTPELMMNIRSSFAHIEPIDQLGLMNDVWALGMAGQQPASDYLELAKATPISADPQVWGDISDRFLRLNDYYGGNKTQQVAFRQFAIRILAPVLNRIGWEAREKEGYPVTILRGKLIGTLAALHDAKVIAEARRRYASQLSDPNALPPELRKTILTVVATHADAATWDELHTAALAEKTPMIKDQLYSLLSTASDPMLYTQALELALTNEPGATNSAGMIATVALAHPDQAFDYAVAHMPQVDNVVDNTSRSLWYPALGERSADPAMIGKLTALADAHIDVGSRRATETSIANVRYRIMIRNERLPELDAWLSKNSQ